MYWGVLMSDEKPQYLNHSESFVRARRNFMFSAVTLIILVAANPATIKIPGLGDDATLPAPLAYLALWLAMAYFAWEYRAEHAYVSMVNSTAAEKVHGEDQALLVQMRRRIDTLSADATKIVDMNLIASAELDPEWHRKLDEETLASIKGSLTVGASTAVRMMTSKAEPGKVDPTVFENALVSFNSTVDQTFSQLTGSWDSSRSRLERHVSQQQREVVPQLPIIAERLRETAAALTALDATYRRVSSRVHSELRNAFRWKDTWLAVVLGALATLMLAVPLSGYEWVWRDWGKQEGSQSVSGGEVSPKQKRHSVSAEVSRSDPP